MYSFYRISGIVCVVLLFILSTLGLSQGTQAAATKAATSAVGSASVGTLAVAVYDNAKNANVLYVVDTDGKNLKQLDVPITPYSYKRLVAWSPDGTRLAFVDKSYLVEVSNLDGSNAKPIPKSRQIFAWSPDSQQITFDAANGQIVNADVATGEQHPVITLKENQGEHIDALAWSSDAKQLLYILGGSAGPKLHVVAVASGDDQVLNTTVQPSGALWNLSAGHANQLAYFGVGSKGGIFTYDLSSKATTPLFSTNVPVIHADWSPDGTQFVYDGAANGALAVVDITSRKTRSLPLPDALLKKQIGGIAWRPTPVLSATGTMAPTSAATVASQ